MEGSVHPPIILGPAPWFRIEDKFLRQGPHGAIVGSFRQSLWEVQSRLYVRYHCTEPHIIRFEDSDGRKQITLGQFSDTWVEDGILHPDHTLRARHHPDHHCWHDFKTDTYWTNLIFESADNNPRPD